MPFITGYRKKRTIPNARRAVKGSTDSLLCVRTASTHDAGPGRFGYSTISSTSRRASAPATSMS